MQISFPNKSILLKFTFVNKVNVAQHAVGNVCISKMQKNMFQTIMTLIPFCLCQDGGARKLGILLKYVYLDVISSTGNSGDTGFIICSFRIVVPRFNEFIYANPVSFN